MRKNLLILFFFFCATAFAFAQKSVEGTVKDGETGEPMPGVSVSGVGSTIGTITDIDGKFKFKVNEEVQKLKFSFVGYATQEVSILDKTLFEVKLLPESRKIDEVVVVAYGIQRKRNLTGAVSSIKAKDIENLTLPSFENALQGKTAGVVMSSGARKGTVNAVRVRGTSSISASSQPLYVIDGVPQGDYIFGYTGDNSQYSPLSNLNPDDIQSIQVLKDASSSALYGARASNGVILITTKRGKEGSTKIDFNSSIGFQEYSNFIDMLSGSQYTELFNEAYFNTYGKKDIMGDPSKAANTNWVDEVMRTGLMQKYSMSVSGGNAKTQFYSNLTFSDDEGYTIGDKYQQFNARLNVDHQISEEVKFRGDLSLARVVNDRVSGSNSVSSASTLSVLQFPNMKVYNDDGTFNHVGPLGSAGFASHNLVRDPKESYYESTTYRPTINMSLSYSPKLIEGLTYKIDGNVDYIDMKDNQYNAKMSIDGDGIGKSQNLNYESFNKLLTNVIMFNKTFKDLHKIDFVAGHSYQETDRSSSSVSAENFPNDNLNTANSAADVTSGGASLTYVSYESLFARLNYSFDNKYVAEFSVRRDGSSRFGSNNRYAIFPAGSLAWIISDEPFVKNLNLDWLSLAKLRTSFGLTGNSELKSSPTSASASVVNFASLGLYGQDITGSSYSGAPGLAPTQLENPDLKWEQTAQFDIGLNLGFFKNRISLELDYYEKKTTDLLLEVSLPSTSGFTSIYKNIGELENKGFEISLQTENFVGEFKWSTQFNLGLNRNKILNIDGQIITNGAARAVEGKPIGVFYLVKYAGVDPDNGDALYYDKDGYVTNKYSSSNRIVAGDPNPDFTGGITNNFSYKGFDLSVFMQFSYGNDVYNDGGRFHNASMNSIWNQDTGVLDRWQKPGDITDVPQLRYRGGNGNSHSTRYLEDGSYLRIKNITFGYSLPKDILSKVNIRRARVYASAQNWFTFTDYSGNDPEVTSNGVTNIGQGITFLEAPTPKVLTFGLNLGF